MNFTNQEQLNKYIFDEKFKNKFLRLNNVTFKFEGDFRSLEYGEKFKFTNLNFQNKFTISKLRFDDILELKEFQFKNELIFDQCNFTNEVQLKLLIGNENFKNKKLTFINCIFQNNLSFPHKSDINPSNVDYEISFSKSTFKKTLNFQNIIFHKNVDFSNCKFMEDVHLKINESKFIKGGNFAGAHFKGKLDAWSIQFNESLNFEYVNFEKRVNMSSLTQINMNSDQSTVNFIGANFNGNIYLYDCHIHKLDLFKTVKEKGVFLLGSEISVLKRETARLIKNEFINQNNKIEALKYHALEMKAYRKELWNPKVKPYHKLSDKFILWSNYISNEYNLNPIKAFLFIIITSITFFSFYLISLDRYCHIVECYETPYRSYIGSGRIIGDYFNFINPVHKVDFIEKSSQSTLGGFSIAIDSISRIIIGYGYYQLIQAFRKFSKR